MKGWLLLLALALLGSAYFSGTETAVVSSGRLRQRARGGRLLARLAERLYLRSEHTLAVLLLGNNAVNVLASIAALMITERALAAAGFQLAAVWTDLISSVWVAAVILVLAEALPKSVARLYAERLTRASAPVLLALSTLLKPVLWLLDLVYLLLPGMSAGGRARISWETVQLHLETARDQGVLAESEAALIRRIGLLNRMTAEALMTPLDTLPLQPRTSSAGALRALMAVRGAEFCLLYGASPRQLLGMVPARRLLGLPGETPARDLASPLRRVPATRTLLDLIDELQLTRSKFAVVTDPAGHCLGAVFLDALLQALVQQEPARPAPAAPAGGGAPIL